MIKKVDFYLGVFMIMLAVMVKDYEVGPVLAFRLISAEMEEAMPIGYLLVTAWWGTIICLLIKLKNLLSPFREEKDGVFVNNPDSTSAALDKEKIGLFLAELRESRSLSLESMGELLHVSGRTIRRWENGKSLPTMVDVANICREFNLSPDEVFNGKQKDLMQ